jgi:Sec-independent protein translocase protein TatA
MPIIWNTGSAAKRFRARAQRDAAQFNLRLKEKNKKKKRASSPKLQAKTNVTMSSRHHAGHMSRLDSATIKKDNKT